jgi:4-amino-4-deoxy-L-arabinose transferase-like glycosyltransferase
MTELRVAWKITVMLAWLSKKGTPLLFAFALLVRVAFVLTLEDRYYYFDTVHYDKAAKAIIAGEGFGEGYEFSQFFQKEYALPPLYPMFLAAVYFFFGPSFLAVRLVEAILGAWLCVLIYKIALRLFNQTPALLAGYFSAIFPHLVFLTGLLYVENIFTLLLALGIWYCLRWQEERKLSLIALASLMFGLACLGRPVVFAFYPFLALWTMFVCKGELKQKFIATATVVLVTILTLTPWTVRNYLIFGKITPVSAAAEKYLGESEEFLDEKIVESLPVAGDELTVATSSDSSGHHFDFYYNGAYDGRLTDSTKAFGNGAAQYAGVMLRAGLPNSIAEFAVFEKKSSEGAHSHPLAVTAQVPASNGATTLAQRDNFEREQLGPRWQAPPEFLIKANALHNAATDDSWDHLAIFRAATRADSIALKWGEQAEARGVKEGGIALRLDRAESIANGYLAWRQPTGRLLLFTIENGKAGRGVAMAMGNTGESVRAKLRASINAEAVQEQSFFDNLLALLTKDSKAFFTRYAGELIHFWSPRPDRFYSQNEFTASWPVLLSAAAFTPVLIFFCAGLFFLKSRWREASLLLFMILSTALIYSFFQTKVRYRMPVEPYMIIIAAHAAFELARKLGFGRATASPSTTA